MKKNISKYSHIKSALLAVIVAASYVALPLRSIAEDGGDGPGGGNGEAPGGGNQSNNSSNGGINAGTESNGGLTQGANNVPNACNKEDDSLNAKEATSSSVESESSSLDKAIEDAKSQPSPENVIHGSAWELTWPRVGPQPLPEDNGSANAYPAIEGSANSEPTKNEPIPVADANKNQDDQIFNPHAEISSHDARNDGGLQESVPSASALKEAVIARMLGVSLNEQVVNESYSFPNGGKYDKTWKSSGTPEKIAINGDKILSAGSGTYCSGFTFAVAVRVGNAMNLFAGKTSSQIQHFQQNWYGATLESGEKQCVMAMVQLGIGREIPFNDATPGDFVQFFRVTKSQGYENGHSAVFLGWVYEGGKVVGINYRSSQGSTSGIGDKTEYFKGASEKHKGSVLKERTYFGRLD